MSLEIRNEPSPDLADYARIPIAFEVDWVLDVVTPGNGRGAPVLSGRPVATAAWCRSLGCCARLSATQGRDPEHQRAGMPILCGPGFCAGSRSSWRLSGLPG